MPPRTPCNLRWGLTPFYLCTDSLFLTQVIPSFLHCQLWQADLICRILNASDHCSESLTLTRIIEFKVDCLWPSALRSSKCTYSLWAASLNGLHRESCSSQPVWYAGGEKGTNCMLELRIRLWNQWENEDRSSDTVRLGAATCGNITLKFTVTLTQRKLETNRRWTFFGKSLYFYYHIIKRIWELKTISSHLHNHSRTMGFFFR